MTPSNLVRRSLVHYWRTNLAVVAGVAIAVSVLAGALLVGDSVRGSLKDLFLGRLGRTSLVLSASHFFPEDFPSRIERQPDFRNDSGPVPDRYHGMCHPQESRRRASRSRSTAVDERFCGFRSPPAPRLRCLTRRGQPTLGRPRKESSPVILFLRLEARRISGGIVA